MKREEMKVEALIYTRVSTKSQETDGSGHISQEERCKSRCLENGYKIAATFQDTFTGGGDFMDRPAMSLLIDYLDKHKNNGILYVVMFDDLKRFARDTEFHIRLRAKFKGYKVRLECLNFKFEDSPEGKFVETVFAAQNQLDREQNQRQVIQKQKARLEAGYWPFPAKLGYTMTKILGHGKVCVPNEKSEIIKQALENFANRNFKNRLEMAKYLTDARIFRSKNYEKHLDQVDLMLRDPFYIGMIEHLHPNWKVSRRVGHQKGIISVETFDINQARLKAKNETKRVRLDTNPEMELRNLICCEHCSRPLTGGGAVGNGGRYVYYQCPSKSTVCPVGRSTIKKEILESGFNEILQSISPAQEAVDLIKEIFDEEWIIAMKGVNIVNSTEEKRLTEIQAEITNFFKIHNNNTSEIIKSQALQKIEELGKEEVELKEKATFKPDYNIPYRTALEKIESLIKSPYTVWCKLEIKNKIMLFSYLFDGNVYYSKKTGYRTIKTSILFNVFKSFSENTQNNSDYVEVGGIEPPCNRE